MTAPCMVNQKAREIKCEVQAIILNEIESERISANIIILFIIHSFRF